MTSSHSIAWTPAPLTGKGTGFLTSSLFPLNTPLASDESVGWKSYPCFSGPLRNLQFVSCHASSLMPGHTPHPPHQHHEEEFLLLLSGEVDLLLPGDETLGPEKRRKLIAGDFVYYPARFPHTIQAVGSSPANYLMLKWSDRNLAKATPLPFKQGSCQHRFSAPPPKGGVQSAVLLEGPTQYLHKLHIHLSEILPDGGYEAHQDSHDVVLVLLGGEIETIGSPVSPHGVVHYAAGEPHGMRNPGSTHARYLVLEFHGHKATKRLAGTIVEFITAHARNEYQLGKARLQKGLRLLNSRSRQAPPP